MVVIEDTWDDGSDRSVFKIWEPVMPVLPRTRVDAIPWMRADVDCKLGAPGLAGVPSFDAPF